MHKLLTPSLLCLLFSANALAQTFTLPENGDNVIGGIELVTITPQMRVFDVYNQYSQGYDEIRMANPGVSPFGHRLADVELIIPAQYVLPDAPRKGIVINVPEMRMYLYPAVKKGEPAQVLTFPISIGREDWDTPLGSMKVLKKVTDPSWVPPKSIREEHFREYGEVLPPVVPPGPDNPMGKYKIQVHNSGYYIHGTDVAKEEGIGMRVTHGCMRMYKQDIETVFNAVVVGTPVTIVNQPYKVGKRDGKLILDAHPHLSNDPLAQNDHYEGVISKINQLLGTDTANVSLDQIHNALAARNGIPINIGAVVSAESVQAADNAGDTDADARRRLEQEIDAELRASAEETPASGSAAESADQLW